MSVPPGIAPSYLPGRGASGFFDLLLARKLAMARQAARGARTLDLGCGEGTHLALLSGDQPAIGADLALGQLLRRRRGAVAVAADAQRLPFPDGAFGLVCCLSALYVVPDQARALGEIARVLAPGGLCLIELGNSRSLNRLVCAASPGLPVLHCQRPRSMRERLRACRLRPLRAYASQALPLWGDRPRWLRPLLAAPWRRLMAWRPGGRRMVDDLVSGVLLRPFAFRHLLLCRKRP